MGLVWVNFFIFYFLFGLWFVVCGLCDHRCLGRHR